MADLEAQTTPSSYNLTPTQPTTPLVRTMPLTNSNNVIRRSQKKRDVSNRTVRSVRMPSTGPNINTLEAKTEITEKNTLITEEMLNLSPSTANTPIPHPRDADPLLISWIPVMPSQEELKDLLDQPPLSYFEARGHLIPEDQRKPPRYFCVRCGYWGRIKCVKCGAKVCALGCYKEHKDECSRYGL